MNIATNISSGTLYLIWKSGAQYWNGSAFEAYNGSDWSSQYAQTATVQAGNVNATPPTDASDYELRLQAGGSPATTDAIVDAGTTYFDSPVSEAGGSGGGTTIQITGDVTYSGPVAVTGAVSFYRGDAVTLEWSIEDYTGTVSDGDVTSLRFITIDTYRDASQSTYNSSLTKAGTASLSAGTLTLSFTLSASDTATLTAGANNDGATKYQCQAIATASDTTLVDVVATVRRRIGVAS